MDERVLGTVLVLIPTGALSLQAALRDARTREIPNACVLAILIVSLANMICGLVVSLAAYGEAASVSALQGALEAGLSRSWGGLDATPFQRVAWWLGLTAMLLLVELVWRRLHAGTHGLGMGDIKLLGAYASLLGPAVLVALALSCLLAAGVATARGVTRFAFGPYLAGCSCALLAIDIVLW